MNVKHVLDTKFISYSSSQ